MTFQNVRNQVLGNIGRYGKSEEGLIALTNRSINLAVDDLKLRTIIPSLLKDLTSISLVSGTATYSLDSDFDIPVRVAIRTSTQEGKLERVNATNLLEKISTTLDTGTPEYYRIFGYSGGAIQIRTYPTYAGSPSGASIIGEYIPVLADLSADSDENAITERYFNAVIRIATALAYRAVVSHTEQPLAFIASIEALVQNEANKIMQREYGFGDYKSKVDVSDVIRKRRLARNTL